MSTSPRPSDVTTEAGAPARSIQIWGNPWIGTIFRVILGAVLFAAGIIKVFDHEAARMAIVAYRIFPAGNPGPNILGYLLPATEVLIGILLIIGLWVRWSAVVGGILMATFIVGIASVWIRGYNIDCGCFGGGGDISEAGKAWRYTSEILRDFALAGMASWLVAWPRTKFALLNPAIK